MPYYNVMVPAYRDKSYVYNCATDLEPGDLVRIERRQFGSSVQFPEYTWGIVESEATDHTTSANDCEPLVVLSEVGTAALEAELQRRRDQEMASMFGVDADTYSELRAHFSTGWTPRDIHEYAHDDWSGRHQRTASCPPDPTPAALDVIRGRG